MSSGTTAEPIQPDAPVTKTRMRNLQVVDSPGTWVCTGSMSATVISIHLMSAAVIIYDWSHEPVGAERARPPGAGGTRSLRRARVRADHGGGDRRAGGAHRADVLPALRRQARG